MAAAQKQVVASNVLSFADKRALLASVTPAASAPSGLRDASVAIIGGSVSSVRSFFGDIATEYRFAEAKRTGQI